MHRAPRLFLRLIAAKGRLLLAASAALALCASAARAGTLEEFSIPSKALGRSIDVSVYKPDREAPASGWPVLYLLHGLGGSNRDWSTYGGIKGTMDRLIKEGRIKPMIVVMPNAGNSWYVDSGDVKGPGNYESALLADVPAAVEKRYAPQCRRAMRAIAGISMGGFGALRFALKRPDRYVAVASLSGAIWQNIPVTQQVQDTAWEGSSGSYFRRIDPATVVSGVDLPPAGAHFGKAFGSPFNAQRFNDSNVFTLLAGQIQAQAKLPAIYLTVGDKDSHNLWRGSMALYETLMADQIPVDFRVTDGDHTWSLWKRSIEDAVEFVDSKFPAPELSPLIAGTPPAGKMAGGEAVVK